MYKSRLWQLGLFLSTVLCLLSSDLYNIEWLRCWHSYLSRCKWLHMVQLMPLLPIISCFVKIQNGLIFLVPAYLGCPGKEAIKWVSVCLSLWLYIWEYMTVYFLTYAFQRIGSQVWYYPFTEGKAIQWSVDLKLLEHAMKVVERIFEHRIWQQIEVDDMQFGFMKGKGTMSFLL